METFEVKALLFQEEGIWVGQCLDIDITCQSPKLSELKKRLVHSIITHIELSKRQHKTEWRRAPKKFWDMFDKSEDNPMPLKQEMVDGVRPVLRISDQACAA